MVRTAKIYFRDNVYKDFSRQYHKIQGWIDQSFLTDEHNEEFARIVANKMKQIGL